MVPYELSARAKDGTVHTRGRVVHSFGLHCVSRAVTSGEPSHVTHTVQPLPPTLVATASAAVFPCEWKQLAPEKAGAERLQLPQSPAKKRP